MLNNVGRARLELIGDMLEEVARVCTSKPITEDPDAKKLISLAWDIKQIARKGTNSAGI